MPNYRQPENRPPQFGRNNEQHNRNFPVNRGSRPYNNPRPDYNNTRNDHRGGMNNRGGQHGGQSQMQNDPPRHQINASGNADEARV